MPYVHAEQLFLDTDLVRYWDPTRCFTQTFVLNCVQIEEVLPTNLSIDDKLINAAQRLGKLRTKKEVVTTALQFLTA
ncbi:MAG: type II toxin-antitoxin system VapB family antitoxin [Bacteroidia bacterium]|nr:type II toxin-antitoxin system VapB family antitoxin [Bacteroidia bacterium]